MKKLILLFLMLLSVSIYSQEVGLVASFPFNNSVSSTPNGEFFGTNLSTFTYVADRNGVASAALSRATNFTTAFFPANNLPAGTAARTISLWVRKSGTPGGVSVFEYGNGSSFFGFFMGFTAMPFSSATSFDFGAQPNIRATNYTITDGVWYHYVVTTNSSGIVNQYVNGVSVGTFSFAINSAATSSCVLGGNYNGAVDDLKIYSRELSSIEVSNLFNYNSSVAPAIAPIIFNVSEDVTGSSAVINYQISPSGINTTSIIRYGLTPTSLTSQVTGFSSSASTTVNGSAEITGLLPGTTYYYRIEATNSVGTSTGRDLDNFRTLGNPLLYEWKFNNSVVSEGGSISFTGTAGATFVQDRNGVANSAISKTTFILPRAEIPNLPIKNSSRTVAVWIKPDQVNSDNIIFTYGNSSGDYVYGGSFTPSIIYNFSYVANLPYNTTVTAGQWKHIVYTYDKATFTTKIYVNGAIASSTTNVNWFTGNDDLNFYLGNLFGNSASSFVGAFDDLKIYDVAITDAEVSNLFSNNTLSSADFRTKNLQVSLYPNPVKDMLHIETATKIKSVNIYGVLGNLVLTSTSKEINVSDLGKGIYMVKVQDADNNISTKKIIKE